MASIRALCNNGILLENGFIKYTGPVEDTIDKYMQQNSHYSSLPISEMPRDGKCNEKLRYTGIRFLNDKGEEVLPHCGRALIIEISFDVTDCDLEGCGIALGISDNYGVKKLTFPTSLTMPDFPLTQGQHKAFCKIDRLPLTAGSYLISLWADVKKDCSDYIESKIRFDVEDDDFFNMGRTISPHLLGKVVLCDHSWIID